MATNNFEKELCNERHERISDILNEHNAKIEEHDVRISEMEKNSMKMEEIVKVVVQSNKELNDKMTSAIERLVDNQNNMKIQILNDKQELEKKILTNELKPNADKWKSLMGYIIAGIVTLFFTLLQTGVLHKTTP